MRGFLTREATIAQYTDGVREREAISPDNWNIDQPVLERPGNAEIQLAMFYSYGSNPPLYPKWPAYFRDYQPPTLIAWGKNDPIFPAAGADPYKRDLKNLEFHLLDTGHFGLEEDCGTIKSHYRLKIAAVNNEGRELNVQRIGEFKLGAFIDFFVSSCFVHFRKPDTDIFRITLDIAQVDPAQVVYIDDRPLFVEVAKGLGIGGIIHTGLDATRKELAEFGLVLPE